MSVDTNASSKKSTTFWTIGRKLVLVSSASIVVAVIAATAVSAWNSSQLARSVFFDGAERVSALTAQTIAGAVKFKKADALAAEFDAIAESKGTSLIAVSAVDIDGAPIVERGAFSSDIAPLVARALETESAVISDDRRFMAKPVIFGKKNTLVGAFVVEWDDKMIGDSVVASTLMSALAGLVAFLVSGIVLAWMVNRMLSRPIRTMTESIVKLLAGEKVEIDGLRRTDEIGGLARSISEIYENGLAAARLKNAVDSASSMMMLADTDGQIVFVNEPLHRLFRDCEQDIRTVAADFNASDVVGRSMDVFHESADIRKDVVDHLTDTHKARITFGERIMTLDVSPVRGADGERLGTIVEWRDITAELRATEEIDGVVLAALEGDFSRRAAMEGAPKNLEAIGERLNSVTANVEQGVAEVSKVVSAVAEGDLSQQMTGDFRGVFAELQGHLNGTVERLSGLMTEIATTTATVSQNAQDITSGADNLSSRAEQQASSLEETAATMEEMSASVKSNADSSAKASALAAEASDRADDGGGIVKNAVSAMTEIEESATKIADIISVIDGIAFQTNLLALNAAVEAARAGDAGKGFAVVASEVRGLAQRSSDASRDIRQLIETSAGQVSEGVRLVTETGSSLERIASSISEVDEAIKSIAAASVEQASGVEEITSAISHMDQITQQNSSLSEQSASTARSLASSASTLRDLVAFFNVAGAASAAAASAEAATDADWRAVETKRDDAPAPVLKAAVGAPASSQEGDWGEF